MKDMLKSYGEKYILLWICYAEFENRKGISLFVHFVRF